DQRERARAVPQALASQVHGDQRRGARRVDGEAGTTQIETVGDAVRGDARDPARGAVDVYVAALVGTRLQQLVVVSGDADEYSGRRAAPRSGDLAAIFQRLASGLEQHPLLRIHEGRLTRRDAEEAGIEAVDVVDEATPATDRFADSARRRIVIGVGVPAIGGNLPYGVNAARQQPPKRVGAEGAP